MRKNLTLTGCLILLFNFFTHSQVSLVFPQDNYVLHETSINFEWNIETSATAYQIQIATDNAFLAPIVNINGLSNTNYQADDLDENQQYYWRVKSNSGSWSSGFSFRIVDFSLMPEVEMWMTGDSVKLDSEGRVEKWYNLKNNGLEFSQNSLNLRPFVNYNNIINHPEIEFNADDGLFLENVDLSHLSGGEVFSFLRLESNNPAIEKSGLWRFGTHSFSDHYPYTNGQIYTSFGNSQRFNFPVPTNFNFTKHHVLNIQSGGVFKFKLDQNEVFTSSSSSPNFNANSMVGHSPNGQRFLDGYIAELILLNTVSNDTLNELVNEYFRYKYAPPVNLGQNISHTLCDSILYAGKHFTSYLWSDGSTADSLIINNSGTYWVEVEDIFGNISSDTIEVILSEFQYPSSEIYCPNGSITWNPNLGSTHSFLWSDGSTAETLVIDSPGDVSVTVYGMNGCVFKSDTLSFQEDLFPTSATLGPDLNLCSGNTLSLSTGASEAVSYLWNTGSTDASIVIVNTGEYSVEVVNINGCVAKDTVQVNIIGSAPNIAFSVPETICLNAEATFQDMSIPTDGATINDWEWVILSDTITNNIGTWQADSVGVFDIQYTIGTTSGCFSDTTFSITVRPLPIVSMQTQGVCQDDEIQFYAGQLTPTFIDTWEWNYGDVASGAENTSFLQNSTHKFSMSGAYDITLIGTDIYGCADTITEVFFVQPKPIANFIGLDICAGNVVDFENTSTIEVGGTIATYQWDFGDGNYSGQTSPNKPYVTHGDYMVSLVAISNMGCSDTTSRMVKVHALPQVDYVVEQACAKTATRLIDNSFVPNGSVALVDWSVNNAPPLTGFVVEKNFPIGGTYNLKQTVKSAFGCNNSLETTFQIYNEIRADFVHLPTVFVANEPVQFHSTSIGANSYFWKFGDFATSTQTDTTIVFTENQIGEEIEISLTVSNNYDCVDSISLSNAVIGRDTDLALTQIFLSEDDGFTTIGVRMENNGSTPIENVEFAISEAGKGTFKEIWSGFLAGGESIIHVLSSQHTTGISEMQKEHHFFCVKGRLLNSLFEEENLANNEVCLSKTDADFVLIRPFPNPINDLMTVRFIANVKTENDLVIYDALGQEVYRYDSVSLEVGITDIAIDTQSWRTGVYVVKFGMSEVNVVK